MREESGRAALARLDAGGSDPAVEGPRVGVLVLEDGNGCALVDYPGNTRGPLAARMTATAALRCRGRDPGREVPVLLIFEGNDPARPIVLDAIEAPAEDDGKLVVEAREEIQLRCGEAVIRIRKDGGILSRGNALVSHARRVNKIKGGAVRIN
jgi:hypothetical protein